MEIGVGEQGGLGDVGADYVGVADELAHELWEVGREAGVEPAVVAHDGVDEAEGLMLRVEHTEDLADYLHLRGGAEVAGVE